MTTRPPPALRELDPRRIDERDAARLADHWNAVRAEVLPEDPPRRVEAVRRDLRSLRSIEHMDYRLWALEEDGRTVATLFAEVSRLPENPHLLEFELQVRPEARGRGLARRLLRVLEAHARAEERTLLVTWVQGPTPGAAVLRRVGGEPGLAMHENQLRLEAVDRDLLRRWTEAERAQAAGYELFSIDGAVPEPLLAPMAELIEVMNSAPRGDLDVEDFRVDAEQLRRWTERDRERGVTRWAYVARHAPSGALAGYTETVWDPLVPHIVGQGGTGVRPEHRGHGLGKWLKAAMLLRVLEHRAEARVVRTGNADSNAAMLAINRALGFAPLFELTIWQLRRERLAAYLAGSEG